MKRLVICMLVLIGSSTNLFALAYPDTPGATTLFFDDFSGTSIDTSKWYTKGAIGTDIQIVTESPNAWTEDGSSLYINSPGYTSAVAAGVLSKETFSPTMFGNPDGKIVLSIGGPYSGYYEKGQIAYLTNNYSVTGDLLDSVVVDWTDVDRLGLRTLDGDVYNYMQDEGVDGGLYIDTSKHPEAWYQIIWEADRVQIYKYDDLVLDTEWAHPTGGTWEIPDEELALLMYADWNGQDLTVDYIKVEYIPEPTTMILLGLGSLLLRRRR